MTENSIAKLTALVVEDEPIIALAAQLYFEEAGVSSVYIAGSVPEALLLIAQTDFDLVLLDYKLRDVSSVPIAEQLVGRPCLTAFASGDLPVNLPPSCAEIPVVLKPYGPETLDALVKVARAKADERARNPSAPPAQR